jgi:hypothetical protein
MRWAMRGAGIAVAERRCAANAGLAWQAIQTVL